MVLPNAVSSHFGSSFQAGGYKIKFVLLLAIISIYALYQRRLKAPLKVCIDDFYVSIRGMNIVSQQQWPCYPRTPKYYTRPLSPKESLWKTPRSNLGKLNGSHAAYRLYIGSQLWATLGDDYVKLHEHGGTAGRAFKDNFHYVHTLNNSLDFSKRCGEHPTMLDMGGGVGSVAAAFKDARGLNRQVNVLTYVRPESYLRMQSIISDRGLPSFLFNFKKRAPFPDNSFDFVHCKWCWHWLEGYDVWLKEVDRLLIPGGHFIFTLSKGKDGILVLNEWDQAVKRIGFQCRKYGRIINLCRKNGTIEKSCEPKKKETPPWHVKNQVSQALKVFNVSFPRLLNINCPDVTLCKQLEPYFRSTLHIGYNSDETKRLLGQRRLAILHNFRDNIPSFPRTYDVINIGCSNQTRTLLDRKEFWMDVHRVLTPGGLVLLLRNFCIWKDKIRLQRAMFNVQSLSEDVILGWKVSF